MTSQQMALMWCHGEDKMANRSTSSYFVSGNSNRNATIRVREDKTGKIRTETAGRDSGSVEFAVSTNPKTNSTALFIDLPQNSISLTGSEARTLYRLLNKHYSSVGKSV